MIKDIVISAYCQSLYNSESKVKVLASDTEPVTFGMLHPDMDSPYYPERSDAKIMRTDVIASIIEISGMFDTLEIDRELAATMNLYIANGTFIEDTGKHTDRILNGYRRIGSDCPREEQLAMIYKNIPPLLALETLTNATMSFIAKYAGIKGGNATYGSTSASGWHALDDALMELAMTDSSKTIVGASNCGGPYSNLMFRQLYDDMVGWHESASSGFILLENKSVGEMHGKPRGRIVHMGISPGIPSLILRDTEPQMEKVLSEGPPVETIIVSGAYTPKVNEEHVQSIVGYKGRIVSPFREGGNMGPANLFHGIIRTLQLFETSSESVGILDVDPFGRTSYVCIEPV